MLQESCGLLRSDIEKCFEVFFSLEIQFLKELWRETEEETSRDPLLGSLSALRGNQSLLGKRPAPVRSPVTPPRQV